MLELPDSWLWDFWVADDGDRFHLFFLFASRALGDERLRHRRASIGHAVSTDLTSWTRVADALVRSEAPAWDDVATWTGSTVRGDDGVWRLFYTGCSDHPVASAQRVMVATSADLTSWHKLREPAVAADPRWYATGADGTDEPFRDPWVFRHESRWHMLTTARAREGSITQSGVIGHAVSDDLVTWTVRPPLSTPGQGFGQLEVSQVLEVGGEAVLLFSCLRNELDESRQPAAGNGGVWLARAGGPLGPFDLAGAIRLTDDSLYSGRAVRDRSGAWQFLAFENQRDGGFVGRLADPIPLARVLEIAGF